MAKQPSTPDVDKIRALIALMEKRGLSRLVLTEDGVTVRLETAVRAPAVVAVPPVVAGEEAYPPPVAAPASPPEPDGIPLVSPTTGTFYRAPAPGEAPLVDVGDVVEVGQTIGIIMAMKVMSEVPAEVAGTIIAIPAKDAALVQLGTVLIIVKPV